MQKFCSIIDEVVATNSLPAWERLLRFPTRCLQVPSRSSNDHKSLATRVKNQLQEEADPIPLRKYKKRAGRAKEEEEEL